MKRSIMFFVAAFLATVAISQTSNTSNDVIYKNFVTPPNSAMPRVWWHWMNGNITKDGIRKDLLWMHRSGIGGFQNFDAALATPQIVEKRLTYMTPEWKDAFRFTTKLADSLKLEMAIAGSPGWSESGGPWVKPENGMKKLVWTETNVKAGTQNILLSKSASITGTFQNIELQPEIGLSNTTTNEHPTYYKDISVIAYKLPSSIIPMNELKPTITSSGGNFSFDQLNDGDLDKTNLLPSDSAKGFAWIQYSFSQPQTIKAVTVVGGGDRGPFGMYGDKPEDRSIEVSDDGITFRRIAFIPAGGVLQQTIAIPPTTAKYFRVTFKNPPPPMNLGVAFGFGGDAPKAPLGTDIAEVVLYNYSIIDRFEEKAGFAPYAGKFTQNNESSDAINFSEVIDLTGKMSEDGKLNWTVPSGNWKIIRFGYSLTGKENHPASPEATGLEVDKLDAVAVKNYFENYLDQYKDATGGLMGAKGLQYVITDSYEAGQENWTSKMAEEFQKRRGYSLIPWMPVLTGKIIKSKDESEKFLWDWRKTIGELIAENHYDQLTTILAKYGMKRYTESHENGRVFIGDGMDVKRKAAVPMSAMWTPGGIGGGETMHQADIRESASVAHIYGQNLVAAESLTAFGLMNNAWSYSPEKLKPTADFELASGLNRFVIHTSVHQPMDEKIPGLGLGPFGQWFNRHETWAGLAKAWTDYLSRSSYLLQQGKFVADIVYFYGEDNNITSLFGGKAPAIPEGYNFDYINADALINLLSVKDGNLVTPGGMSYRVLVLDSNARTMSLSVLKKINKLVKEGATVTGVRPTAAASLSDDKNEFNKLVNETWSSTNAKVTEGKSLGEVLNGMNISPDLTYTKPQSNTKLLYVHRKTSDRDIYWVNNRTTNVEDIELTFRVAGKIPELWFSETGKKESLSYNIANGVTKVKLHMESNDALFVIFKEKAIKNSVELPAVKVNELTTMGGSWNVNFQKDRGAPASAVFNELTSFTNNTDAGVKYFSGTASYIKTITADRSWFNGNEIWLDLGDVKNLAEVIVNGKSLGIIWKKPFRINVTSALKPGDNKLELKVTNLWVNRLIGDQQPGATKITYTTMPFYQANSPLLPSGLLGPVKLMSVNRK